MRQRSEQKGNSGSSRSTILRQVGHRKLRTFFRGILLFYRRRDRGLDTEDTEHTEVFRYISIAVFQYFDSCSMR